MTDTQAANLLRLAQFGSLPVSGTVIKGGYSLGYVVGYTTGSSWFLE
jgi:hypothetical protein